MNVAVISQNDPEIHGLRVLLRNPVKYTVREFLSPDDVNKGLGSYPFDVLIMRTGSFTSAQIPMVLRARARFPKAGLITLCREIDPSARYQVKDVPRHKLLLEEMEIADLPQLIEKMAKGQNNSTRLHPRVRRKGGCDLFSVQEGQPLKAEFVDFGQMGARVRVSPRVPFRKDSILQLHYRSTTEPSHVHRIQAHVIWAEIRSGMMGTIVNGPEQEVGIRFVAAL